MHLLCVCQSMWCIHIIYWLYRVIYNHVLICILKISFSVYFAV